MEITIREMSLEEAKKLGIDSWSSWSSPPSKFDWFYDERETAYIFRGNVIVTPEGGDAVTITGGMLVTFPARMSCTWEVIDEVEKVYRFG